MSAQRFPRAGTRQDLALRKLLQLGGRAGLHGWMNAMAWTGTITAFEKDVITALTRCGVVRMDGAAYLVTQHGRDFAAAAADTAPAAPYVGQVAGPRMAPEKRPLSARHMLGATLMREGALAYAEIPSRYGDQRIAHSAKVRTA